MRGAVAGEVAVDVVVEVWDNRWGERFLETVRLDVEFEGVYSVDPGARYLPDGSGIPPSSDLDVVATDDWTELLAWVEEWLAEDLGRYTLLESESGVLDAVNLGLEEAVGDDPERWLVGGPYGRS